MVSRLLTVLGGRTVTQHGLGLLYASVFLSFMGTSLAFPLRLLYAQVHHATPAQIGLMAAAFFLAPMLGQVPLGWLIDRWGRVPVMLSGMVAHVFLSLGYILFTTPWDLIGLRFAEGLTVAAIRPAIAAYIADVVAEDHRSEAYGALTAVYSGGFLIGPLVGGIIGQQLGFTAAYLGSVIVEIAAMALVWGRVHEPQTHGVRHTAAPVPWRAFASVPLLGAYVALFTAQMVMGMMSSLWSIWTHDLGGSYVYIGATFSVFALPQILLGAAAGRLTDRWGRVPMLLIGGLLVSVVYASYGFMTNLLLIAAVGVVEGTLITCQGPAAQSLLAAASPAQARGRAQGVAGVAGALGGAIAAFASLPLYHDERALPFVLAGVAMASGSVIAAGSARHLVHRQRAEVEDPTLSLAAR
jgi:MFS family permease